MVWLVGLPEVATSVAEPPKGVMSVLAPPVTAAALFPKLSMFPVTSDSITDTIFEPSLFPDASVMVASAVSAFSVFIEAPVATAADPPEVAVFTAEPPEVGWGVGGGVHFSSLKDRGVHL